MKGVNPPSGTRRGRPRNAATAEAERFSTDGQPQGGKSEACCAGPTKLRSARFGVLSEALSVSERPAPTGTVPCPSLFVENGCRNEQLITW